MTPGRRGDGRAKRSETSRNRATWGTERGEWKDLGEVSRGQQSKSYIHEGHEKARREDFKENRPGQALTPARGGGEVPEQAASLLAKTAPALQHHSSHQERKTVHDNFLLALPQAYTEFLKVDMSSCDGRRKIV